MYTYLASPYTGTKLEEEARFCDAMFATVSLLKKGIAIYSPIVHCHPLHLVHDLPGTFDFWNWYNKIMITQSNCFAILNLRNWDKSKGVWNEYNIAKDLGKPIVFYTFIGDEVEQVSEKKVSELVARLHEVHAV